MIADGAHLYHQAGENDYNFKRDCLINKSPSSEVGADSAHIYQLAHKNICNIAQSLFS